MAEMGWPERLAINAWSGAAVDGPLNRDARRWAVNRHFFGKPELQLAAQALPRPADWSDPEVGWGLVLPDDPALSDAERATAVDAPDPVLHLAADRSGGREPVVLRYRPGFAELFRHYTDGTEEHPLDLVGGPRGTSPGALPCYLLLCGGPDVLPWELQLRLNLTAFTGRLDLDEAALGRYVDAALCDWAHSSVDANAPLVWTVEHENGDITWLMRQTIAEPVFQSWIADKQIGHQATRLGGADATGERLAATLADRRPGVVVTTSHGLTGPLDRPDNMRRDLGLLVDTDLSTVRPEHLLANWQPDGVVWYAHACCSAGAVGVNLFDGLVDRESTVHEVLAAVAKLGETVAPLPRALLSAERPARAYIGHIQPTFDWTLRRKSGQITVTGLLNALYRQFFQATPVPVGLAFADWHRDAAALLGCWQTDLDRAAARPDARETAAAHQLAGLDRQCTVILGDPAVAPAALHPGKGQRAAP